MTAPDGGLSAALLQITAQAERLAVLENRVAGNLRHSDETLAAMSQAITALRSTADGLGEAVGALSVQVAGLVAAAGEDGSGEPARGYTPRPPVHWWKLRDEARQKETDRLAAWVEQVYQPFYGHLAAMLGACWREHPLCLVHLDWLSELHSVLYFQPKRTAALLSAQAEFSTRIVPAVSEQFRAETSRCAHRQATPNGSAWRGAR